MTAPEAMTVQETAVHAIAGLAGYDADLIRRVIASWEIIRTGAESRHGLKPSDLMPKEFRP